METTLELRQVEGLKDEPIEHGDQVRTKRCVPVMGGRLRKVPSFAVRGDALVQLGVVSLAAVVVVKEVDHVPRP